MGLTAMYDRWYVARPKSGKDRLAERSVSARGYDVYRPKYPGETERSIFPGYMFVKPRGDGDWELLRSSPFMRYGDDALLKINFKLVSIGVEDPDFLAIRETEIRIWRELGAKPPPPFRVGDPVRIRKGPWIDFLAKIGRVDDKNSDALIDMLGRRVRARVGVAHLSSRLAHRDLSIPTY